jgi:hypothetical protein
LLFINKYLLSLLDKSPFIMNTPEKTPLIFRAMNLFFWLLLIGFSIKTGALIISFYVSLYVNPVAAADLYRGLDLSAVLAFSKPQYIGAAVLLIVLTAFKAALALMTVQASLLFSPQRPFREEVSMRILRISRVAGVAALLALAGTIQQEWLSKSGVVVPVNWGAAELLFLAGILYSIALVFRRGVELQSENELTV